MRIAQRLMLWLIMSAIFVCNIFVGEKDDKNIKTSINITVEASAGGVLEEIKKDNQKIYLKAK